MPAQKNTAAKGDYVYSDESFDEDSYNSDNDARKAGRGSVLHDRLKSATTTNICSSVQSPITPITNKTNSRQLQIKSQLLKNRGWLLSVGCVEKKTKLHPNLKFLPIFDGLDKKAHFNLASPIIIFL